MDVQDSRTDDGGYNRFKTTAECVAGGWRVRKKIVNESNGVRAAAGAATKHSAGPVGGEEG